MLARPRLPSCDSYCSVSPAARANCQVVTGRPLRRAELAILFHAAIALLGDGRRAAVRRALPGVAPEAGSASPVLEMSAHPGRQHVRAERHGPARPGERHHADARDAQIASALRLHRLLAQGRGGGPPPLRRRWWRQQLGLLLQLRRAAAVLPGRASVDKPALGLDVHNPAAGLRRWPLPDSPPRGSAQTVAFLRTTEGGGDDGERGRWATSPPPTSPRRRLSSLAVPPPALVKASGVALATLHCVEVTHCLFIGNWHRTAYLFSLRRRLRIRPNGRHVNAPRLRVCGQCVCLPAHSQGFGMQAGYTRTIIAAVDRTNLCDNGIGTCGNVVMC
ncbi:hypothetical protein HPB51_018707 [Rhipicephalus microplus]|uniref:Uncharacterized protein n=1 Tax=Rhipicephalus microplus TaxID=6941 RepID=A0A9J6DIJ0_RHIMP|nr:hypothetical protein HPB51_018707 [Rhipicephalus microplus]